MEEKLKQITFKDKTLIRVVFFGPESTGKSTLAEALAESYNVDFVEEYVRAYAEKKKKDNQKLSKDDVLPIAIGQMQEENIKSEIAEQLLICDTDLLETKVYSEFYYNGYCPESLKKYAYENQYDLYFLTYIDIPWEDDGIRDQPNQRLQLFNRFEDELIKANKPYIILKGTLEERLEICKTHINSLLRQDD